MGKLLTTGDIAKTLNAELHRVLYALRSRNIEPVGRIGNLRAYTEDAVGRVREALEQMDERRGAGAEAQSPATA